MTRYHANNILLKRKLTFISDVKQWSHALMIPLHCLWAKSNNRTRGQFGCDVTFVFVFISFIHMHGVIVAPRFQDVQIKQVDCKMSTKNVNNYK